MYICFSQWGNELLEGRLPVCRAWAPVRCSNTSCQFINFDLNYVWHHLTFLWPWWFPKWICPWTNILGVPMPYVAWFSSLRFFVSILKRSVNQNRSPVGSQPLGKSISTIWLFRKVKWIATQISPCLESAHNNEAELSTWSYTKR